MDVKTKHLKVTDNGFHQMCRLCLSRDIVTETDIFLFSFEFGKATADIIMECIPVHITRHDKMPVCICQLCFTQLKKFHQFQMQAVQSDRTLQRCLQELSDSHPQVKVELDHEDLSGNFENRTSNADIKCEPFEINDERDFSHSKQKNTFNKLISFKSKIKDELTDDDSLSPTDCVETLQTLSKDGGSKDSMTVFDDTKIGVETPGNVECVMEKIFVKTEDTYEYLPFKDGVETFKDVESVRFNASNLDRTEQASQNIKKKFHSRKVLLKKSTTKTGEKRYQCDICQKCFKYACHLKKHKLIHTEEKPYQCDICKMRFRMMDHLKNHKLTHTGEKPFQCDTCKMCFRMMSHLKNHKLTHTGEKPYQCDICQMCFRMKDHLKNHKITHTGEKPYQCDVCQMCFSVARNLKRHNLIHTGEKPYQCDICKVCFRQSFHLKSHKLKHTGE